MRRGRKGNTAKTMADAAELARRYREGSKIRELLVEYHTQAGTIKRAILTQMSAAEYKRLVSLHNKKRHYKLKKKSSPKFSPEVEQLRLHYERVEDMLREAVEREGYAIPKGFSKTKRPSTYVFAEDADRMLLAEAEIAKTPQDALPDGSTVGDFMKLPENIKRLQKTEMPKLLTG